MAASVILLACCLSLHSVFGVGHAGISPARDRDRGLSHIRRPGFAWPRGLPRSNPLWKRFWDRFRPKATTVPPTTTSQPTSAATETTTPPPVPVHDSTVVGLCDTKEFSNSLSCKLERDYPDIQESLLTRFGEDVFLEADRQPAGADGAGTKSCGKRRPTILHDTKGEELEVGISDVECETMKPSVVKPGSELVPVQPGSRPDPETAFNPCGYSANMVSPIHAVTVSGETVELWAGTQRGALQQQKFREVKCTSSTPNHQGCEGKCVEESTWHRAVVIKSGDPPKVGWDMIVVKASCSCHVITPRSLFTKFSSLGESKVRVETELDRDETEKTELEGEETEEIS
ncbi:uncharacterized protein LOC144872871 [Branchiostoma floridae x Branchiostoma japonicum]